MNAPLSGLKQDPLPTKLTGIEAIALAIYNLLCGCLSVAMVGSVALYVCSLPATLAAAMYSDRMFYRGLDAQFMTWCGYLLDRHFWWFIAYLGTLFVVPLFCLWAFKLAGLSEMLNEAEERCHCLTRAEPYPGRTFVRASLCALCVPFLPTVIAAIVGYLMVLFVISMALLYVLWLLGKFGGFRYLATRMAVRDGVRDGFRKRR